MATLYHGYVFVQCTYTLHEHFSDNRDYIGLDQLSQVEKSIRLWLWEDLSGSVMASMRKTDPAGSDPVGSHMQSDLFETLITTGGCCNIGTSLTFLRGRSTESNQPWSCFHPQA